jgi:uncharacterized protein (DUF1499 family)
MNMETLKKIGSYIILLVVIGFLLVSNRVFAGAPPTNIGVNNGKLAGCPATPNCVSSQVAAIDPEHTILPIQFGGDNLTTIAKLKQVLQSMPNNKILKETDNYLYLESTSKLMGFVDDVEFYLDKDSKTIQVRSASRLGESDLGVNRQRIEKIRVALGANTATK